MKTLAPVALYVLMSFGAFAGGMSEDELLCDLASPAPLATTEEMADDKVDEYVQARIGPNTRNRVSVCLSVESDIKLLGLPWERRDLVEIPYQSPTVTKATEKDNPDLIELGRFVYVFSELRRQEESWSISPYTSVRAQSVPSSVTSIPTAVEFARTQLPSTTNVNLRVVTVEVSE